MYVFAVTARFRWPTCSPIRAHGTPRQVQQRDPAVAKVVRREHRHAGGLAPAIRATRTLSRSGVPRARLAEADARGACAGA